MFRLIPVIILFVFLGSFQAFAQVKDNKEGKEEKGMGLKTMTPEMDQKFRKEHAQVKKVKLNKLGLERVNAARAKKNLPPLDLAPVSIGEEVESIMEGAPNSATTPSTSTQTLNGVLPTGLDNSTLPWFPPVRSQGSIGSCVAWASAYYQMTYMNAMAKGVPVNTGDNANIYTPKWVYNMINDGVDGGSYFSDAYNVIARHGAARWSEFPYDYNFLEWSLDTNIWKNAIRSRTQPVTYITQASTTGMDQIKQLLTNGYILVMGTYITSWQFTSIKDDPATPEDDAAVGKAVAYWLNGAVGGHAMTIVGYNDAIWTDMNNNNVVDAGEKGALRIANSWGNWWNDGGFTWLAYDALKSVSAVPGAPSTGRVAAFQSDRVYVLNVKQNYEPKLIAEFTVNHLKRSQMALSGGVSDPTATAPTTVSSFNGLYMQGGPLAFNGSTMAVDGTFAVDMTELVPATTGTKSYYLQLSDNVMGDPLTVSSYKLLDANNNVLGQASGLPMTVDGVTKTLRIDYSYSTGNQAPVAVVSSNVISGNIPLTVAFDGSASSDFDGRIVSYAWNFGNGSQASGPNVSNVYSTPGNYSAVLTVTDDKGATATATIAIAVVDPNVVNAPTTLSASASARTIKLTWKDNSNNEQGFYVEQGVVQSAKGKSSIVWSRISQTAANATTESVTVSTPNTYYYRVQAFNSTVGKVSAFSNQANIRVR
jgi:PKD repeat protein/C1A family cysteine protease